MFNLERYIDKLILEYAHGFTKDDEELDALIKFYIED